MYTIIRRRDGKYDCEGRVQDGTERWTKDTLEEAIASMKEFAKANGTKLKNKHITYMQPMQVVGTKLVPWEPFA